MNVIRYEYTHADIETIDDRDETERERERDRCTNTSHWHILKTF